jgi:hypothetical protein
MKQIGFSLFMVMSLLCALSGCAEMKARETPPPGGECEYKSYEGSAKIISIIPREEPTSSREEYEIKFLFLSEQEIEESYAQVEGREFLLLIKNRYFPRRNFIERYGIKVGKIFPCTLEVIVGGSCTPFLFEFPFTEDNIPSDQD